MMLVAGIDHLGYMHSKKLGADCEMLAERFMVQVYHYSYKGRMHGKQTNPQSTSLRTAKK